MEPGWEYDPPPPKSMKPLLLFVASLLFLPAATIVVWALR